MDKPIGVLITIGTFVPSTFVLSLASLLLMITLENSLPKKINLEG